jgi:hypothetical protein
VCVCVVHPTAVHPTAVHCTSRHSYCARIPTPANTTTATRATIAQHLTTIADSNEGELIAG